MLMRRKTLSNLTVPRFRAGFGCRCAPVAALLLLLAYPEALPGQALHHGKAALPAQKRAELSQRQRALHLLNRFTFGPRPGDVAEVRREGLNAWFAQQLHPETLPDDDLRSRLAQFPATQLPQAELFARFPSPEQLRQYGRGTLSRPDDSTETAIYADAALRYQEKRQVTAQRREVAAQPAGPVTAPPLLSNAALPAPKMQVPDTREAEPAFNEAAVNGILALPPQARFARLVSMSPEQMQAFRVTLKGGRQERLLVGLLPAQAEEVAAMESPLEVVSSEAMATRLLRDVYSDRQLQAVMADFWSNHFNVYLRKNGDEPYLLAAYERDAILPHALGRFEDLLVATAQSPAMLVYLDNWTSMGPGSRAAQRQGGGAAEAKGPLQPGKPLRGINENYARELMELHTLGVNGGYTQQDIIEVAKCFSGWTVTKPTEGRGFTFNASWHEPGPKTVLGHVIPESGEGEGLAVLHLLASSPSTAKFLSTELAERFVSDTPPAKLVDRMTAAYLRTDGDIGAVLDVIFHAPEFWSTAVYRAKVKTPLEFVASALRASGADVSRPQALVGALGRLGMPLYGMQTPNGYSWEAAAWVSSNALLTRMNFALTLSSNRVQGTRLDWSPLVRAGSHAAPTPEAALEQRLETALLGEPATEATRAVVLAQSGGPPDPPAAAQTSSIALTPGTAPQKATVGTPNTGSPDRDRVHLLAVTGSPPGESTQNTQVETMAGLLLGSPEFQRR